MAEIINAQFQLRHDTAAAWTTANPVLRAGEFGVETDTFKAKFGNGSKTWKELPYIALTEAEIRSIIDTSKSKITEVTADLTNDHSGSADDILTQHAETATKGDILIIHDKDTTGNYGKNDTAYVYDGSKFVAFNGNVSADNVIIQKDILCAGSYTQVGNVTKTNTGTATIEAAGKNLSWLLTQMFTKELQPSKTNPAVSLTTPLNKAYEVGTAIEPEYSATFNKGSYTYGPDTGITVSSWEVTNSNEDETLTSASGKFTEITVSESTKYTITAKANYTAGAVAKTNIGNNSNPEVKIAAGSATKTSVAITGYRAPFWGYKLTSDALSDPTKITSDQVRALQQKGSSQAGLPTSYTVPTNTKQIYFLALAGTKNTITVKNASALNAPVAFTKVASGVDVDGANNFSSAKYDLWYANFDAGTSGSANLVITWA